MTTSTFPTNRELRRADGGDDRRLQAPEGAARAARDFWAAMGPACDSPGTTASPIRMAEAYAELLTPREFEPTTFPNDPGHDQLVVVKAISMQSVCEHPLLPFLGIAHVAYLLGPGSSGCPRSPG